MKRTMWRLARCAAFGVLMVPVVQCLAQKPIVFRRAPVMLAPAADKGPEATPSAVVPTVPAEPETPAELPAAPAEPDQSAVLATVMAELEPLTELPAAPEEPEPPAELPATPPEPESAAELPATPPELATSALLAAVMADPEPVAELPTAPAEPEPAAELPAVPAEPDQSAVLATVMAELEPFAELPAVPAETKPAALLPAVPAEPKPAAELPERVLPTMTITDLELADTVDVVTLLRLMAKMADVNLLISPNVAGTVGFSFRGIAWDQAFRSILSTAGLTYVWQGDVLRVMTLEDVRRELELETVLRDREAVREDLRLSEPMVMRVIPLRYLMASKVEKTVSMMLAVGADGVSNGGVPQRKATVSADVESNSIILHAIGSDIEKAVSMIAELDRPRPLIQIEAKIVEATRDTARQLGMQWGGQSSRLDNGRLVTVSGGGRTTGGYTSDFPAQFASGGSSGADLASQGFSLGMASDRLGGSELLNLQLTALQQQGEINIESSPTVTTLDNETAVIESGEERAYQTSSGTGSDTVLEWKEAVLKLEVTPHVVDGSRLRVKIIANKDSFDETKPQSNNEFPVNKKRAQATVMLLNGETTMIGGFSLESSSDSMTGIPFLMRIPLLGALFRNKSTGGRFDETIIFITPTIL